MSFTVGQAALRAFLTAPSGPIAHHLVSLGVAVESLAKIACPVDTGRLRGSINTSTPHVGDRGELQVTVGTNVEYARAVHEGHWTRHAKRVGPGVKVRRRIAGQPFLLSSLKAVIR